VVFQKYEEKVYRKGWQKSSKVRLVDQLIIEIGKRMVGWQIQQARRNAIQRSKTKTRFWKLRVEREETILEGDNE